MIKDFFFIKFFFLKNDHIKYLLLYVFIFIISFGYSLGNTNIDNTGIEDSKDFNTVLSAYAGNDTLICSGGSVTLKASNLDNGVNYTWYKRDAGGLVNLGSSNPQVISGITQNTTFIFIGDDFPSDKDSLLVKVSKVTGFTASATCSGQTYSVAGNITYSNPPATGTMTVAIGAKTQVFNAPFGTSKAYSITGLTPDGLSHNVTVTFSALPACTYSYASYISPTIPVVTLNSPVICSGETTQLIASGADTYSWANGLGTQNPMSVKPSVTTGYRVTGTLGGCTNTAEVNIVVYGNPVVNITAVSPSICTGQSTTLTAEGGTTYQWDNGQTSDVISVSPVTTTTYTVTAYDHGCSGVHNISIAVNNIGDASISSSPSSLCVGDAANLRVSDGDNFIWSNGSTDQNIYVSPVVTTTYTVTITKAGCSSQASITVPVHDQPSVTARTDTAICYGTNTNVTATGSGYSTLKYVWSSTQVGSSIPAYPIKTTTYTVTIADGHGCTQTDDMVLTVNPIPSTSLTASKTTICKGETVTVTANNADSYVWSGGFGTVTSISNAPTTTTIYRVTGTSLNCSRVAFTTVTVTPLPSIVINNPVICYGGSAQLTATGASTYLWSNSLGTSSSVTVSPLATSTYSVTGTASGCSNTSSAVVTVQNPPFGGTVVGGTSICTGNASPQLTLTNYTGNILNWQYSIDGTNWTNITGTNSTYTPGTLTQTTLYRAIVQNASCQALSVADTVFVDELTIAGNVTGGTTICEGQTSGLLSLSGNNGSVSSWEYSEDGSNWTTIANLTSTYTSPPLISSTFYRAVVKNGACPAANSGQTQVQIGASTSGGTLSSDKTICQGNNSGLLTLSNQIGTVIHWQLSTDGVTWTDFAHLGTTYTSGSLSQTTHFRVEVQNGSCTAFSTPAIITVDSLSSGGQLTGGMALCIGSPSPALNLSDYRGTVQNWQYSTDSSNWNDLNISNTNYTPAFLTQTTYYRTVVKNGVCPLDNSIPAKIRVDDLPDPGTLNGTDSICFGAPGLTLTLSAYTGNIIKWQTSEDNISWNDVANTNNSYTPGALTQNTYFRTQLQNGTCFLYSDDKEIIVDIPTIPGIVGSNHNVCQGSSTGLLNLTGNTGNVKYWEYSDDSISWNRIINTGSSYNENNLISTRYYRAVVKNGVCNTEYSIPAKVTVDQPTIGGIVTGGSTICRNNYSNELIINGYVGDVLKWQFSLDSLNWNDIADSDSSYTSDPLTQTTYFRGVLKNGLCSTEYSVPAKVTVVMSSIGGTMTGGDTICTGSASPVLTVNGYVGDIIKWQTSPDSITWNDNGNSASSFDPGILGQTTYYRVVVQSTGCSPALSSAATVVVLDPPNPGNLSGGDTICAGSQSPLLTLNGYSNSILKWQSSTDQQNWNDIIIQNDNYSPPSLNNTTYYRVLINGIKCANVYSDTAAINVDLPSDGGLLSSDTVFCKGMDAGILQLNTYNGTIQKWQTSDNNGLSWTDISNQSDSYSPGVINTTGAYLYRVEVKNGVCPVAISNNVSVEAVDIPLASFYMSGFNICQDDVVEIGYNRTIENGYLFSWNFNGGSSNSSSNPESYLVSWNTQGTKDISLVVNNRGCLSAPYHQSISVKPLPVGTGDPSSQSICSNSTAHIDLSANIAGTTFNWVASPQSNGAYDGSGDEILQTLTNISNASVIVTYTITPTINGCFGEPFLIPVTVNPIPTANYSPFKDSICSRDTLHIPLYSGTSNTTFTWNVIQNGVAGASNGSGSEIKQRLLFSGLAKGTVTYTITPSVNTCLGAPIELKVTVLPLPSAYFEADASIGCPPLLATFTTQSYSSNDTYTWDFGDGSGIDTLQGNTHLFEQGGHFSVSLLVTDPFGCKNTITRDQYINLYPKPEAKYSSNPETGSIYNPELSFMADDNMGTINSYLWNFKDSMNRVIDTSILQDPVIRFENPGLHNVCLKVVNDYGCKDSICRTLSIDDGFEFYIPKAFTPNHDGINETFGPKGVGFYKDFYEMYIFNRWGEQVFYTNDINNQWDGLVEEKPGRPVIGIYTWIINTKTSSGQKVKYKGNVLLLK